MPACDSVDAIAARHPSFDLKQVPTKMHWQLHVLRLAVMTRLPLGSQLRRVRRRLFGYPPDQDNLRGTLRDFADMSKALWRFGRSIDSATVLEIGTGWFPVIPITLALGGAKQVLMTDLTPHLDAITFEATVNFLRGEGGEYAGLEKVMSIDQLRLKYLAPFRSSQVPDGSLDLIVSRTVLEHIPPDDLRSLLVALKPKLAPHGIMVHCVDHSDHLEHRDKRLSKVNFLTWPDWKHSLVNALTNEGENRLRHSDYPRLFEETGFRVLLAEGEVDPKTQRQVAQLDLAPRFRNVDSAEAATLRSIYVIGR